MIKNFPKIGRSAPFVCTENVVLKVSRLNKN